MPFTPFAEKLNGRVAMVALTYTLYTEFTTGAPLFHL